MNETDETRGLASQMSISSTSPPAPGAAPRLFVVVLRIGLLLLAAAAATGAIVIALGEGPGSTKGEYLCPMHPAVRSSEPGQCPICRMALEAASGSNAAGTSMNGRPMAAPADLAAVENVRKHKIVDFVRRRSLPSDLRELRAPAAVNDDGSITAIFYRDEIDAFAPDEGGTFVLSRAPAITFAVRRMPSAPVPWDGATAQVRFTVERRGPEAAPPRQTRPAKQTAPATAMVKPGDAGWVELARRPRDLLTVPASAIVQSPDGPYVLASLGAGRLERRPIEIGETFPRHGFAVVLSGLHAQDRVVSRAAFFVDAARKLADPSGEAGLSNP